MQQADPDGYETNLRLGFALYSQKQTTMMALPYLARALSHNRLDRDTPVLFDCFANLQLLRGDFEEALTTYNAAAEVCAEVDDFQLRKGDVLLRLGRIDEASATYKQANAVMEAAARANPRDADGRVVRFLGPNQVICRYFGEMGGRLDMFLKSRRLLPIADEKPVLLAPRADVANQCLLDCFAEHLCVVSDQNEIEEYLNRYPNAWLDSNYLPIPDGRVLNRNVAQFQIQHRWEDEGLGPLLDLSDEHRERGRRALTRLGFGDNDWFVALHVRETGYFDENHPWSRSLLRNADIETYLPAIEAITSRGGWVVRIGDPSMTPLAPMERVIDYANGGALRADWMDIFLIAACRFVLGTPSGPQGSALAFGTPFLGTNYFAIGVVPPSRNDLFIPKTVRAKSGGRKLGIRESLRPPRYMSMEPLFFEKEGLEIVDNTAEEIEAVTVEMLERLDGSVVYSDADEARNRQYRELMDPYAMGVSSRLGRHFLGGHPELLDAATAGEGP